MVEEKKPEDLRGEVDALKQQVKKLTVLLAQTGQQLLQLQMQQRRESVTELDSKNKELQQAIGHYSPGPAGSTQNVPAGSGFITEGDLDEMVGELQGQLTILDTRSQSRVRNARAKNPGDELVALPNADGAVRPDFPKTLGDVAKLSDDEVFTHWSHFEMIPGINKLGDLLDEKDKEGNDRIVTELYESLCHYIGVEPQHRASKA